MAALVRQACDKVHRDLVILPRKKQYYQCVLTHLPPVETDSVTRDILGACASKYDFRS